MNNIYKKIKIIILLSVVTGTPNLIHSQNMGLFIEFESAIDPLRLLDVGADNPEASGMEKMNPGYEMTIGYRTPYFLKNWIRFHTALDIYGNFYWKGNGLVNDAKTINNLLTVGMNISPNLYLEWDSRGNMIVEVNYAHKIMNNQYIALVMDTKFSMLGHLYSSASLDSYKEHAWKYSTVDFTYLISFRPSPLIQSIDFMARARLRFNGSIYDKKQHIDTDEQFNLENPYLHGLMTMSIKTQVDFWLTKFFAARPYAEFVIDGREHTSEKYTYGLNLGITLTITL